MLYRYSRLLLPVAIAIIKTAPALCAPQPPASFTIRGELAPFGKPVMLHLSYMSNGKRVQDSVKNTDGHFTFKGTVSEPATAVLSYQQPDKNGNVNPHDYNSWVSRDFYVEPANIRISSTGTLKTASIQGGPTETESQVWKSMTQMLDAQQGLLRTRLYFNRSNYDSAIALKKSINNISLERERLLLQFIKKYPSSVISWEQVKGRSYGIEPETLEPEFRSLSPKFRNSKEGKEILERLNIAKLIHIGSTAPDFTQKDIQGNPVSLSSFRGKYVLIDFWASWCGICRLENPNVLKAYNAFKDKGFDVLGISIDDSTQKDKWIEAVKHDNMPWQQLSDLKGRTNEAAVLYGIRGIPQNVLIDPRGIVIAKNLRDKDLMEKLEEIFGHMYVMGNIAGLKDTMAVFYYYKGDNYRRDTVAIKNGVFSWNADITEPQMVMGVCKPSGRNIVRLYAENRPIHINGNADAMDKLTITGSALQDEANAFNHSIRDITAKQDSIYALFIKGSKEQQSVLLAPLHELAKQRRAKIRQYITEHPASALSLNMINEMSGDEYGEVNALYNTLTEKSRQSAMGKRIAAIMEVTKRKAMGTPLLNFSQADSSGKMISLTDFKGKYVLVDFWASWCGPCRAENPNVLKAYNAYKDKGFTVVGISLDDNSAKWKKAILDDHMPWTELSDLKGWKNEMAVYYGIQAIPDNFLVDPQGKIIAKGLRGEELHKTLASLLN